METAETKDLIRTRYGSIAAEANASANCAPAASSRHRSNAGTNPGPGCGDPQAIAAMLGLGTEQCVAPAMVAARRPEPNPSDRKPVKAPEAASLAEAFAWVFSTKLMD